MSEIVTFSIHSHSTPMCADAFLQRQEEIWQQEVEESLSCSLLHHPSRPKHIDFLRITAPEDDITDTPPASPLLSLLLVSHFNLIVQLELLNRNFISYWHNPNIYMKVHSDESSTLAGQNLIKRYIWSGCDQHVETFNQLVGGCSVMMTLSDISIGTYTVKHATLVRYLRHIHLKVL